MLRVISQSDRCIGEPFRNFVLRTTDAVKALLRDSTLSFYMSLSQTYPRPQRQQTALRDKWARNVLRDGDGGSTQWWSDNDVVSLMLDKLSVLRPNSRDHCQLYVLLCMASRHDDSLQPELASVCARCGALTVVAQCALGARGSRNPSPATPEHWIRIE